MRNEKTMAISRYHGNQQRKDSKYEENMQCEFHRESGRFGGARVFDSGGGGGCGLFALPPRGGVQGESPPE